MEVGDGQGKEKAGARRTARRMRRLTGSSTSSGSSSSSSSTMCLCSLEAQRGGAHGGERESSRKEKCTVQHVSLQPRAVAETRARQRERVELERGCGREVCVKRRCAGVEIVTRKGAGVGRLWPKGVRERRD